MPAAQSITQALQFLTHFIVALILPLAGIAALTLAVVQTAKNMLPLRRWFQRSHVEKWLAVRAGAALPQPQSAAMGSQQDKLTPQHHLVHLAAAGDARSFYSLPIEQLCGQINASTQVLLDYPALHWNLLRSLASDAHPQDLALINPTDAAHAARKALFRKPAVTLTDAEHNDVDDYVAARNRVSQQIQRSVDSLQISVSFRWKFWMQLASILISAALGAALLSIAQYPLYSAHGACFIVLAAIFSGFLAPVVRDLVAAIEQVRT